MDNELDDVARSLFNGQLPPSWRKLAPATLKNLGGWMEHFMRRNQQYLSWVCGLSYLPPNTSLKGLDFVHFECLSINSIHKG